MNQDKIEIISEQLAALIDLWHLLRSSSSEEDCKERAEELLLLIFEMKLEELQHCITS